MALEDNTGNLQGAFNSGKYTGGKAGSTKAAVNNKKKASAVRWTRCRHCCCGPVGSNPC